MAAQLFLQALHLLGSPIRSRQSFEASYVYESAVDSDLIEHGRSKSGEVEAPNVQPRLTPPALSRDPCKCCLVISMTHLTKHLVEHPHRLLVGSLLLFSPYTVISTPTAML